MTRFMLGSEAETSLGYTATTPATLLSTSTIKHWASTMMKASKP